jgi:hypothetical protein
MWQRQSMRKAMIPLTTAGGILKMIVRSLGIDGHWADTNVNNMCPVRSIPQGAARGISPDVRILRGLY